uniref:Mitochondrial intermembrane space import and assembly protein 40 isoform X2 n=1 Tax=Drosophila rhopaloa TaxID=1041015 RepID=A0A6P4F2J9_DRORH
MEETRILNNQIISPPGKMKPASAQKEHKNLLDLSDSKYSLDQIKKELKKDQSKVDNETGAEKNEENAQDVSKAQGQQVYAAKESSECNISMAKTKISGTEIISTEINKDSDLSIPKITKENSKEVLNDAVSNKTLTVETKPQENEENLKENKQREENLKSLSGKMENKELIEAKELVIKEEQHTIPDSEKQDQMSENSSPALTIQEEKPKETTETKAAYRLTQPNDPQNTIREDMEKYFSGIVAEEENRRLSDEMNAKEAEAIRKEEQKRKNCLEMLQDVSQATCLSSTSSERRPSRSVLLAILQRSAKAEYQRKMNILKDNFSFRLGLIKQFKHDMKNNFKSEAQQLYSDYHSFKNQTEYKAT